MTTTAKKSAFWTAELTATVKAEYARLRAEGHDNKAIKETIAAAIGATAKQVQGKLVAERVYIVDDAAPAAKTGGVQKVHLIKNLSAELGVTVEALETLEKANFAALENLVEAVQTVKQTAFEMGASAAEGELMDDESE